MGCVNIGMNILFGGGGIYFNKPRRWCIRRSCAQLSVTQNTSGLDRLDDVFFPLVLCAYRAAMGMRVDVVTQNVSGFLLAILSVWLLLSGFPRGYKGGRCVLGHHTNIQAAEE